MFTGERKNRYFKKGIEFLNVENTVSEIKKKKSLNGVKSRLNTAEEKTSEFEYTAM